MAGTLSTAGLLTAIYNRGNVPQNSVRFQPADLILMANQELTNTVFPLMLGMHEEFFLTLWGQNFQDHSWTSLFPIPRRAYARGLREITYTDTGGNIYDIPYITLADGCFYPSNNQSYIATSTPFGFYFVNDSVKFVGNNSTIQGTLQWTFVMRPPDLQPPDVNGNCLGFQVQTITPQVWNVSPTTLITSNVNTYQGYNIPLGTVTNFDIIRQSTGATLAIDCPLIATSINSGTQLSFTAASVSTDPFVPSFFTNINPSEIYIMPSEQSGLIPIPPEANQLLILAVCMRVYETLGYTDDYQVAQVAMDKIAKQLQQIYSDRIQGEPKVFANRRGLANYTLYGRRGITIRRRVITPP